MNGKGHLEVSVVIDTVLKHFKMVEDVISPCRKREIIKVKHIAMYCCRLYTDKSLSQIGRFFNNKHCNVIAATHSVNNQADIYHVYRMELNEILSELNRIVDYDFAEYKFYDTDKI